MFHFPSYLSDKVLTEGWGNPFPGVDTTVHPDSLLLGSGVHTNLDRSLGLFIPDTCWYPSCMLDVNPTGKVFYLEQANRPLFVGLPVFHYGNNIRVSLCNLTHPVADLKKKKRKKKC